MILADISDYRELARRKLPHFLFEYLDGGSFSQQTLFSNTADLQGIRLKQQVLRDVSDLSTATTLFGQDLALPVVLAPVGIGGLYARRGEVQAARAAHAANVPFTLSTVSACSVEETVKASGAPVWFQLYMLKDRGFMYDMLQRAKDQGCTTLVFTVDMPVPGIRYRDMRSGLSGGGVTARKVRRFLQGCTKPSWAVDVGLLGRPHSLGNVAKVLGENAGIDEFWAWLGENFDPAISWADLEEIRKLWDGPLVIKGILSPEDATAAFDLGADGVIVSNHGGRQLDGASSSIRALQAIREAVGPGRTVLMDGGIRTGLDIVRAMALGADAVMIGRPWVYALAARGGDGISAILEILQKEMIVSMALTGRKRVGDLNRSILDS